LQYIRETQPTPIFIDGALDVMTVYVVQKPICGLCASVITIKRGDKVLDERNIVEGCAEGDFLSGFGKIQIQLSVDVWPIFAVALVISG
jgi:hypothetical protein